VVLEDDFIRNKQRLDELCHTRHMAVWHDHSDIAGNKYYVIIECFLVGLL